MTRRKDKQGRVLEKGESQRKDGTYMYRYTDIYGERKSIYSHNLSDLRDKESEIRRDIEDGIDFKASERTLNEQFARYMNLKPNLANSTRNNYLDLWENNVKNSELGNKPIANIRKSDILGFYSGLAQRGLKYSTIKVYNSMISPALELAVDDDILRKNPCKGCLKQFKKNPDKKICLSVEQQEALIDFVQGSRIYSVYYPMIIFALETGVRYGELIGLTWRDIDFKSKTVSINHQLQYRKYTGQQYRFYADTPKTKDGIREIPLTELALEAAKIQRINQFHRGWKSNIDIDGYSDFVFTNKNKRPIMPAAFNSMISNVTAAANKENPNCNLPHISAHILRHTACTRMAESGMDIKVLQYIMGHGDTSVTMKVYNHITPERNRREMEKLEKQRIAR